MGIRTSTSMGKAHGPIPHNCVIIHLDQNKQNNSLENLKMVHRNITPIMHHLKGGVETRILLICRLI